MRSRIVIGATVATVLLGAMIGHSALQTPAVRSVDEKILREGHEKLCGATGNCIAWFFRRVEGGWHSLALGREYPPDGAAFAFLPLSTKVYPIWLWKEMTVVE